MALVLWKWAQDSMDGHMLCLNYILILACKVDSPGTKLNPVGLMLHRCSASIHTHSVGNIRTAFIQFNVLTSMTIHFVVCLILVQSLIRRLAHRLNPTTMD